jgi:hypothetical protein
MLPNLTMPEQMIQPKAIALDPQSETPGSQIHRRCNESESDAIDPWSGLQVKPCVRTMSTMTSASTSIR